MSQTGDLVLLTGLSGFVAKHIALRLLNAGYRVRGTVRSQRNGDEARRTLERAGADVSRLETVVLDLMNDDGWAQAASGCRFVQHTASPFPGTPPRDKFALVPVAQGGTLRVMKAAIAAGVERVVLTSSVVAIYHGHEGRQEKRFTEADVSNVESRTISSYAVSKTMAEQAAWTSVEGTRTELAVLNPALVLGPGLDSRAGASLSIIASMMKGLMPIVPAAQFGVVDVRDVAEAHVRAMTMPEAAGRRFILSAGHMSLVDIGRALQDAYPSARRLPKRTIPTALIRLAGRVSRRVALLQNELDPERTLDNSAARTVLGLDFHSPQEAVQAAARSLVETKVVTDPGPALSPS